jgi:hypothetical protein
MSQFEVAKYGPHDLRDVLRDDPWAVRDEAHKRQNAMAVKVAAMRKKLAKAEAEMIEMERIYEAALQEIAK